MPRLPSIRMCILCEAVLMCLLRRAGILCLSISPPRACLTPTRTLEARLDSLSAGRRHREGQALAQAYPARRGRAWIGTPSSGTRIGVRSRYPSTRAAQVQETLHPTHTAVSGLAQQYIFILLHSHRLAEMGGCQPALCHPLAENAARTGLPLHQRSAPSWSSLPFLLPASLSNLRKESTVIVVARR